MGKLKCNDCDQVFDESMDHCPNCGCPASACQKLEEDSESASWQPYGSSYGDGSFVTTDTGVKYEKTIKIYAKVIWIIAIVIAALMELGIMVNAFHMMSGYYRATGYALLSLLLGTAGVGLFLLVVYVVRAFIMVVHNISINVHEINMKIK